MRSLFALVLALLTVLLAAPAAVAAPSEACLTPTQREAHTRFQERLRQADSVDKARRMADRRLKTARGVLRKARVTAPRSAGLADGLDRVRTLRDGVASAATPDDVAAAFDLAPASYNVACDLTTGETIATVLGFILGILPGIILLILLC